MNSKPHQYIFLNGPPGSGKDLAAEFIIKEYIVEARHMKFADPLKATARMMFNVQQSLWDVLEKSGSQAEKDMKRRELLGMSWRELLIWLSEDCMKPKFGKDVFGVLFAKQALQRTSTHLTVVSDCGFVDELSAVATRLGVQNCHVLQLHRPGCDFAGDSRSYINATDCPSGVTFQTVNNVHERDMFRRQILIRVNKILGGERVYD